MKKSVFIIFLLFAMAIVTMSFVFAQDQKIGGPWNIPAEYKSKKNPHAGDASLVRMARAAYGRHCRSCHGNTGLGDGPMARNLGTFPGDFSKKEWQEKYNDGEIYFMSFIGRDEMPNFESQITDEEERWAIVNYIRSFKK
jgi:mono/diheme cytochrome c family protein